MGVVAAAAEFYQLGGVIIAAILGGGVVKLYMAQAEKDHLQAESTSLVVSTFEKALAEARAQIEANRLLIENLRKKEDDMLREIRILRMEVAALKAKLQEREEEDKKHPPII